MSIKVKVPRCAAVVCTTQSSIAVKKSFKRVHSLRANSNSGSAARTFSAFSSPPGSASFTCIHNCIVKWCFQARGKTIWPFQSAESHSPLKKRERALSQTTTTTSCSYAACFPSCPCQSYQQTKRAGGVLLELRLNLFDEQDSKGCLLLG